MRGELLEEVVQDVQRKLVGTDKPRRLHHHPDPAEVAVQEKVLHVVRE